MGAIGRNKLAAERAAAAALADRVALRAAGDDAVRAVRTKAATPGFLFAAFAAGLVAGTFAAGARTGRRGRDDAERAMSSRVDGARSAKLASAAAGLLRIADYYLRRS